MKFLKVPILAVFAILVASAAIGPAQAGATILCQAEAENVCPEESEYLAETEMVGSLAEETKAKISTSLGNIECSGSTIKAKTSETEAELLAGNVTGLTFTECKLGGTGCTLTTEHLPFAASWQWTKSGDGSLAVSAGEKGIPAVKATCGAVKCTASTEKLSLGFTGGEPSSIVASEEPLSIEGLLCGETSSLTATYTLTAPESGYVFLTQNIASGTRMCKTSPFLEGGYITCKKNEFYEGEMKSELDAKTAGTFTSGGETITCDKIKLFGKFARNGAPMNPGGITTLDVKGAGAGSSCTSNLAGETPDVFVEMLNVPYSGSAIVFKSPTAPEGEMAVRSPNAPIRMKVLIELTGGQKFCEYDKDELVLKIKNGPTEISRLEINGKWSKRKNSAAACPATLTQFAKLNFKQSNGTSDLYVANVDQP